MGDLGSHDMVRQGLLSLDGKSGWGGAGAGLAGPPRDWDWLGICSQIPCPVSSHAVCATPWTQAQASE